MKTLQLSEEQAIKIYETATPETKIILESTFGKRLFEPELITSYEDACRVLGLNTKFLAISKKSISLNIMDINSNAINKCKKRAVLYKPYFLYNEKTCEFSKKGVTTICENEINMELITASIYYYTYEDADYAGEQFKNLYADLLL